ncbi:g12295 [Coccomyxa viridis]|uniref:Phospholipase D n=1 Tax=Coccomyxa viridis TaxID=1274662 RepID=A0ABP1GE43_9CHLO
MAPWLHGTLYVHIHEAKNVPIDRIIRMPDKAKHRLKPVDKLIGKVEKVLTRGEHPSNAYVVVSIGDSRRARSSIKTDTNPQWDEKFSILVADQSDLVWLTLKDADTIGAPSMGVVSFPAQKLVDGEVFDGWFDVLDLVSKPVKGCSIRATISFRSVYKDPTYDSATHINGVPDTYLPVREGCRVTMYNDAHQDPSTPPVDLPDGRSFQVRGAWCDIYEAICNAKHMIYITGWSVYDKITLVRDPSKPMLPSQWPTLGELLIRKADEGVRVLLLVWDDATSINNPLLKGGLMMTHDEETRDFFAKTKVVAAIVPREGGTVDSTAQKFTKGNMFTHHQKSVIVDAQDTKDPEMRQLVAFIGGLDLCDGRYDTSEHSLFHTIKTVHSDDFHQACCPGSSIKQGGPRQPWHDIHCKLEGPVATDVLVNFVQRWLKQAPSEHREQLLPLPEIPHIVAPETQVRGMGDEAAFVVDPADPEAWRAQIFRSIDSDSTEGLPSGSQASALGLDSGKGKTIDKSIHSAYVTAIRRAQHFIYIENQYFLGSSHCWEHNRSAPSRHLIPLEIALKIVSKIIQGERFAAYIVLPMYSEGDPESNSVQEILTFQTHTIRMMYKLIGDALKAHGSPNHPRDYLNFFCLGNRETKRPDDPVPEQPAPATTYAARAYAQRRFLIYVHSKMMIVDDDYVIIGSANINQRSQDGTRDTEIAVGASQHAYHSQGQVMPRGQVHGFRMNLWREHTNAIYPSYYEPSSLQCVREMYGIAKTNWDAFCGPDIVDLCGHLLIYPMLVNQDGSVQELPGAECFPDSAASVFGASIGSMPDVLTT